MNVRASMDDTNNRIRGLNILIVDDEVNIRRTMAFCLESEGHAVTGAGTGGAAVEAADRRVFDLIFLDLRLEGENGLDLIPQLLTAAPTARIVVVTAYASIESAVVAIRGGAYDFLAKPFDPEQIRLIARQVAALRALEHEVTALRGDLDRVLPELDFHSACPAMQRAVEMARHVAAADATILLGGESGTGKTVLARAIHGWSPRAGKPFAVVSCASLNPELLESELFGHVQGAYTGAIRDNPGRIAACEGGTLLMDEVGDLPPPIQPKLLRFLQDREYERVGQSVTRHADVRIIAASGVDLKQAVAEGRFREDLYYRLHVIPIWLPPLRERREDIPAVAERLLAMFNHANRKRIEGFSPDALATLQNYGWPGNLRELRNVVERAVILCRGNRLGIEHLPEELVVPRTPVRLGDPVALAVIEEQHIRRVLASAPNLQAAADILGVDATTLWRRRKQYGLD